MATIDAVHRLTPRRDMIRIDGFEVPRFLYCHLKHMARTSGQTQYIGHTSTGRWLVGYEREELRAMSSGAEWVRHITVISPWSDREMEERATRDVRALRAERRS